MGILKTVDQISYKKILSIAVFLTVSLAVPVALFLMNQETKLTSKAAYEKPEKATAPKATVGPIPQAQAEIGRVYPWVGKIGDIVWIQGVNFGVNPISKQLKIGGVVVNDSDIAAWNDDLIEAIIPEGAIQGGIVEIKIGNHSVAKSLPYVLYDTEAKVKLGKTGEKIIVKKGGDIVGKYLIWTGDDEIATEKHVGSVNKVNNEFVVFDTQGLPIKTILLFDKEDELIPYYVDVVEFDF